MRNIRKVHAKDFYFKINDEIGCLDIYYLDLRIISISKEYLLDCFIPSIYEMN